MLEYKSKLIVENETIPDPIDLHDGWIGEKLGMKLWPRLLLPDISRFYEYVCGKLELKDRLEGEYKQGKAYRYFTTEFLGEVMINNLTNTSKFCILKSKCVPSQRVNAKQYDLWCIVKKDTDLTIGGQIMSAYCTCTAGLMGTCNHIAALLFRVEAAISTGANDPTCTSVLAKWNIPATKKQIEPDVISSFLCQQENYNKRSILESSAKRKEKVKRKTLFDVMSPSQKKYLQDGEKVRLDFYSNVSDVIPKSCFVELMENKRNSCTLKEIDTDIPTLKEFARNFKENCDPELNVKELNDLFTDSLILSDEQIKKIYDTTVKQSQSDVWLHQRNGRLTASKFKSITKSIEKCSIYNSDHPTDLISQRMGYSKLNPTWQMKYGINNEPHAKKKYTQIFKSAHKNSCVIDPGMTVLSSKIYISATPDLEINCSCHGPGLVEIKCPSSLIGQKPSCENYKHIQETNGEVTLKRSSEYFYQIQGQLGVTGRSYCDFFVFTFEGYALIRIDFDLPFWCDMLLKLELFWGKFIATELLTEDIKKNMNKICSESELVLLSSLSRI